VERLNARSGTPARNALSASLQLGRGTRRTVRGGSNHLVIAGAYDKRRRDGGVILVHKPEVEEDGAGGARSGTPARNALSTSLRLARGTRRTQRTVRGESNRPPAPTTRDAEMEG
jgi:hypothetical protein